MADETRGQSSNIRAELLREGKFFSFFQALRLLRFFLKEENPNKDGLDYIRQGVRIRPKLSLSHPPTDIDEIEEVAGSDFAFRMTVNFLGLYGESTPLPVFYTEDLIYEYLDDQPVNRDFLDIINYPIYLLLFDCWAKYRTYLQVIDDEDPKYMEMLYSLMGVGIDELRERIPEPYKMLRYVGLFTQFPKSALGLKVLLSDALNEPTLEVIPCIKRRVSIPHDQRLFLGVSSNILGKDSHLGEEVDDRMGKIRIKIGPVDVDDFQRLLPGTDDFSKCKSLVRIYLMEPLDCEMEIVLERNQAHSVRLGEGAWSRLGLDTWVFSGEYDQRIHTFFDLT